MSDADIAAPTYETVRAAARRLESVAARTPLLESRVLSDAVGRRIFIKAECLQHTGSFKLRGAYSHLSACGRERLSAGVAAVSSGNHAQGVALAARILGVDALIVMPEDAPATKRENTALHGAKIELYDRAAGVDRDALVRRLVEETGRRLVWPYDDALVISGQGTVGLELVAQARAAFGNEAEVLVCCGGGGLSSGVALALEGEGFAGRVRPVEPEGFDDWARSLASGARQSNAALSGSICDAVMTPTPGRLTWEVGKRLFGPGVVVSDRDARRAMAAAFRHLKLVLEPGGAVALAAALFSEEFAAPGAPPLVVVASGGNVDRASYAAWIDFARWSDKGLPI